MKNTNEIYTLVDTAVDVLISRGKSLYGTSGLPHALGYTQSTLAHVLIELNEINPNAAERFFARLENFKEL